MEIIKYKNYTIEIEQDAECESPREWDNLGRLCLFHKRHNWPNESNYDTKDYDSWDELIKDMTQKENICVLLMIKAYDHSNVVLTADPITATQYPFNDYWDSGTAGFIYATKQDIRKEYKVKRISPKLKAKINELLINEVETFSQYLNGDVYCYTIKDMKEDFIESCGGFYGDSFKENELISNAQSVIDYDIKQKQMVQDALQMTFNI